MKIDEPAGAFLFFAILAVGVMLLTIGFYGAVAAVVIEVMKHYHVVHFPLN